MPRWYTAYTIAGDSQAHIFHKHECKFRLLHVALEANLIYCFAHHILKQNPLAPFFSAVVHYHLFVRYQSPTTSPVSSSPFIDNDQQLTLQNCLEDLNAANTINADELTFDEYSNFLQNLGNRVCFVPDGTFNTARDVTFNQHRCLSRIPCAGSSTVDMTALNILDFCKRSYNFALSSSSCDGVSPTQPNPPSPTVSPSTVAPSRAPSAEPSSLPSLEPSVSNAPSVEVETRGSGAVARQRTQIWAYIITALACARLLRQ